MRVRVRVPGPGNYQVLGRLGRDWRTYQTVLAGPQQLTVGITSQTINLKLGESERDRLLKYLR